MQGNNYDEVEELWKSLWNVALSQARKKFRNPEDAEDAASEAIANLFRYWECEKIGIGYKYNDNYFVFTLTGFVSRLGQGFGYMYKNGKNDYFVLRQNEEGCWTKINPLNAYLREIVNNLHKNWLRKNGYIDGDGHFVFRGINTSDQCYFEQASNSTPDPQTLFLAKEKQMDDRQLLETLKEFIAQLSPQERQLLVTRIDLIKKAGGDAYRGLNKEIAKKIERNEIYVAVVWKRIRNKLSNWLMSKGGASDYLM